MAMPEKDLEKTKQMMVWIDEMNDKQLLAMAEYINTIRVQRRQALARKLAATLEEGTRVRFTGGKPRYLTGQLGTVIERKGSKALIRLDHGPQGKFRDGRVLAPLTLLEAV